MILGLCGPKDSGKSTLAELLKTQHQFKRIALADPIKEMCLTLVTYQGCSRGQGIRMFWGDLKEVPSAYLGGRTPRHAMQTLGTEWGRKTINWDFWKNVWHNKVQQELDQIVVDDVRFENEVQAIRNFGGKVIRIMRKGTTIGLHSSEREYEKINCDWVLTNDESPQNMLDLLEFQLVRWEKDSQEFP